MFAFHTEQLQESTKGDDQSIHYKSFPNSKLTAQKNISVLINLFRLMDQTMENVKNVNVHESINS